MEDFCFLLAITDPEVRAWAAKTYLHPAGLDLDVTIAAEAHDLSGHLFSEEAG